MGDISVTFISAGENISAKPKVILEDTNKRFTSASVNDYCFWLSIRLIFGLIDDVKN